MTKRVTKKGVIADIVQHLEKCYTNGKKHTEFSIGHCRYKVRITDRWAISRLRIGLLGMKASSFDRLVLHD